MATNTVKVELVGVDKSLSRTMTSGSKSALRLAGTLQSVGKSLTKYVTLPIIAVGAASVVAAEKVDESYDLIRSGTGATGRDLEGLKKTFRDVAVQSAQGIDEVAKTIADLNTRTGATGKRLEVLSTRFLELSRITKTDVAENVRLGTRLFGDWSIKTSDQVRTLDKLYRTTEQTGVGLGDLMETVVKFGAPLRNLGFDFDSSIAMLGKWEKEGVNVDTALTGMRFALKKFASEGKDPLVAMGKAIEQIKELPKLKALAIGKDTFGLRAFSDVVAAIREGRFEYDDLIKSISDGKDTVGKAAADTLSFSEKLAILKNKLTITGAELGEKLLPTIEKVADIVSSLADRFSRLSDSQQEWIIKIGLAAAALGPLLSLMGSLLKVGVQFAGVAKGIGSLAGLAGTAGSAAGGGGLAAAGASAAGAIIPVAVVAIAAGVGLALAKANQDQSKPRDIKSPGNTFGLSVDDKKATEAIHRIIVRINNLKARLAEKMAMGLDTSEVQKKLDRAQMQLDMFKHGIGEKVASGHITATRWLQGIAKGEVGFKAFKSHVTAGIDTGKLNTSGWTDAMYRAYQIFLNIKAGMQAPISSHMTITQTTVEKTIKAHARGGIVTSPQIGLVGEAGPEAIIPLTDPGRAAEVMADAGLRGPGGDTIVNVYLDSDPIAAKVEVRQAKKRRTRNRTLGLAPA